MIINTVTLCISLGCSRAIQFAARDCPYLPGINWNRATTHWYVFRDCGLVVKLPALALTRKIP